MILISGCCSGFYPREDYRIPSQRLQPNSIQMWQRTPHITCHVLKHPPLTALDLQPDSFNDFIDPSPIFPLLCLSQNKQSRSAQYFLRHLTLLVFVVDSFIFQVLPLSVSSSITAILYTLNWVKMLFGSHLSASLTASLAYTQKRL